MTDLKEVFISKKKNLKEKNIHDILFVGIFAIALFIFVYYTCTPREFSDDDWGIANYFAGTMGAEYATPYNKFINFLLGWIMYVMYQLMLGPNWFIITQELIVMISFALLQYILIQKLKDHLPIWWCYVLTCALLIAFELSFLCRLSYTQTATVGSIMGFLWMIYSYQRHSDSGFICAGIFTVFSSLYRFGCFEMCLPFVLLVLMNYVFREHTGWSLKENISCMIKKRKLLITVIGIAAGCFIASKINTAIYNSDYYAEYNAFNSARASVVDYAKAPYDEIAEELEAIGVSRNDYSLMTSWNFADLSFFTTDLFREVAAVEPKEKIETNYIEELQIYFKNLCDPSVMYNKFFYMGIIILVICLALDFRHMLPYSAALLLGTVAIEIYLKVFVRRYPSYVRTGLLFTMIVTALMIIDFSKLAKIRRKNIVMSAMSALIVLGLLPLGNEYYLQTKGTFEYDMDGLALYEYFNGRENDIFMIPTGGSSIRHALRNSYSIFEETKPGIMRHTVGLGGWSTNNPWVNEVYSSWGIDYPMSQIADDNVYLMAEPSMLSSLRQYVFEHRNIKTTVALTDVECDTAIYKISDRDMPVVEAKFADVKSISVEYNQEFETCDVTVTFDYTDSDVFHGRVFLAMTNDEEGGGYYMVYGGHDMAIEAGTNKITAMIPVAEIFSDESPNSKTYSVNLMLQDGGSNIVNSGEPVEIVITRPVQSLKEQL